MTSQEKADELILKFKQLPQGGTIAWYLSFELSKKCALIAVNEMLNEYPAQCPDGSFEMERHLFWQEVKQRIENYEDKQ